MSKLDTAWAMQEIGEFLNLTERRASNVPGYLGTVMRGPRTEADARSHVIEQILDRVLAHWTSGRPESDKDYRWLRTQASRARMALERQDELREKLGDGAPEMDASRLHPWAWDSGAALWRTGHYHQAVMQAAIRINAETQAKLGRVDVNETNLFNEAFSLNAPKIGAPRLRLAPDDGSDTYTSLHRGARAFAEGLYAAIRNPGAHRGTGATDEHSALEQLAAFSVLARWIDEATVDTDSRQA